MIVDFNTKNGVILSLETKKWKDLETNINGFLDKAEADDKYNFHDVIDILKTHGIELKMREPDEQIRVRDKAKN